MNLQFVDLHTHSYYSDGTMSPKEILNEAIRNNISVLSITDHDVLDGSKELMEHARDTNIRCISGVELDAVENGINYHILGYGFDLTNSRFNEFVFSNRLLLDEFSEKLVRKMENDNSSISIDEYNKFNYNRVLGGWKALHYFVSKGLVDNIHDGITIYQKYNHSYKCGNFHGIREICNWIHNAGGEAVLAHPGDVITNKDIKEFTETIMEIIDFGIDGIECFYPSHSKEITDACLDICKKHKLMITSGSDCHGKFSNTRIGQLQITLDDIILNDL